MDFFTDDQIRQLIKERNLKTAADVQNMLKEMFGKTLQQMLEAELENELGYSKYNTKDKKTSNSRNGNSTKKVRSDLDEIELNIPRDRNGEFEPVAVKKRKIIYLATDQAAKKWNMPVREWTKCLSQFAIYSLLLI